MSATRRPATWLVCAWFAAACVSKTAVTDGAPAGGPSVDARVSPRVPDLKKDPPLLEGRVLALENNGGEPRAPLTIRVRPGTTQSLQITDTWLSDTYHLLVTVGAAVGSGLLTYDFRLTRGEGPANRDALKGSALFGRHGRATAIEWVADDEDSDARWRLGVGQELDRLLLAIPIDPVGVGAVWRVDEDDGPKWSTTVRLVERTDEGFRLNAVSEAQRSVEGKGGMFRPEPVKTEILWRFSEPLPREAASGRLPDAEQKWEPGMTLSPSRD